MVALSAPLQRHERVMVSPGSAISTSASKAWIVASGRWVGVGVRAEAVGVGRADVDVGVAVGARSVSVGGAVSTAGGVSVGEAGVGVGDGGGAVVGGGVEVWAGVRVQAVRIRITTAVATRRGRWWFRADRKDALRLRSLRMAAHIIP